ncbi:hypothetical protein, partial [Nocardioides sp.]|uniref:COG1470 family protein n=1 Tax=Nocardioides sp. TaxID=35761 RepID=UPI002736C8C7
MQVTTAHPLVVAEPGRCVDVVVDVVNTSDLIDGVTARVIGLDQEAVHTVPAVLPLFPDSEGQITVTIDVPSSQPAGLHPLTIEVVSHGTGTASQYVDINLSVSARPSIDLSVTPRVLRGRRTGRFVGTVHNTGNVVLEAGLKGAVDDRRVGVRVTPDQLRLEPGA